MLSAPTGRLLLDKVATPEEFAALFPSKVAPLKKFTVPRGAPVGVGATVAVMVTDCPKTTGFGKTVSDVVVGANVTVSLIAVEVDVANPALPE